MSWMSIHVSMCAPAAFASAIRPLNDSRDSDVVPSGPSVCRALFGLCSRSMMLCASSNAPAACLRMSSARCAMSCSCRSVIFPASSVPHCTCKAEALTAISDRLCASVSCASVAIASASCWLARSDCSICARFCCCAACRWARWAREVLRFATPTIAAMAMDITARSSPDHSMPGWLAAWTTRP